MQNRRLWTAGSKTKKLSGLSIKNRGGLELFLHCSGLRVISKESRESLAKWPVRRGIFRSGPLDRDLRAQDCLDRDLISSVGLRSNGSDLTGAGAAAICRRRVIPRWRAVGSRRSTPFPALRGSFRPVLGLGVVSALRVTHLGPGLGSRRSVAECAPATAGQRGSARRSASVPATGTAYVTRF